MTNKNWRKKIAMLLAGSMLVMHMPVMAEDGSDGADQKTEVTISEEKKEEKNDVSAASQTPADNQAPAANQTPADNQAPAANQTPAAETQEKKDGGNTAETVSPEASHQEAAFQESGGAEQGTSEQSGEAVTGTKEASKGETAPAEGESSKEESPAAAEASSEENETAGGEISGENIAGSTELSRAETEEKDASSDVQMQDQENAVSEEDGEGTGEKTGETADSQANPATEDVQDPAPAADTAVSGEKKASKASSIEETEDEGTYSISEKPRKAPTAITTANVSVTWKGDDNTLYDIRPGFLAVRLQKSTDDGETFDDVERYELNEENGWQIQLENLPTTQEDGKEIIYRWVWEIDETPKGSENQVEDSDINNLPGYVRTQDEDEGLASRREYTHETQKEKYTVSINWDNAGDSGAKLPEYLEVTLPDGRKVKLSAENGWTCEVELPVTSRDLDWTVGAADGWLASGNVTDYDEAKDSTVITFNRKWATEKVTETTTTTVTEQVPVGFRTLTIQYWIDSKEAAPAFVGVYEDGQTYNVAVPKVTGYRALVTRVKGTISEDTTINVRYVPNTYRVTVYYRYLNGDTAAPTAYRSVKTGSSYSIETPSLSGYAASASAVSGKITGRDLTYVVYYTGVAPVNNNGAGRENEQMIELETIDDYETPLGLGEVGINAGECFE